MSAVIPTPAAPAAWTWPADVLEYADKHKLTHGLEPLRQAALRLFPTGQLKVWLDKDPEIRNLWAISFEMSVPIADVPDLLKAENAWMDELFRIYPYPRTADIVVSLRRVR